MTATLNRLPVIEAMLTLPALGAWHADVQVDSKANITGKVTLAIDGVSFVGTVSQGGLEAGRWRGRIVGGAGGLTRTITPRYEAGYTVGVIAKGVLADVGEVLSASSDASTLSQLLDRWERIEGKAGHALLSLVDAVSAVWRVLPDGTVWIGQETWPAATVAGEKVDTDFACGVFTLAPKGPTLLPGQTYQGQRIDEVVYHVTSGGVRCEARVQGTGSLVRAMVERLRRETRYLGVYAATIVSQSGNVADCIPDDPALRGMGLVRIPLRFGLPGTTVTVPDGARCFIGFEGGSPRKPYLAGWEAATAMTLIQLGSNTQFVALANLCNANFDAIKNWMAAVTFPTGVGPTGTTLLPPPTLTSVAATKVKAE